MKLSYFPHECFDIVSQNFIHRCILAEYRALFIFKVNGLITRSPGHKTGGCRGVKSISIISQYMQSYWFSKQSKFNIIYNISVITITNTMSIILANFGKYAISDCPFIPSCYSFTTTIIIDIMLSFLHILYNCSKNRFKQHFDYISFSHKSKLYSFERVISPTTKQVRFLFKV